MNLYIFDLNVRTVVVSDIMIFVVDLIFRHKWPIVDHKEIIPSNYSESIINSDIIPVLRTINSDIHFIFFSA